MDPSEILNALEKYQPELPREALEAAINDPEAITPGLLMVLKYTIQELETLANDPDYMAYKYAMYLLAQFREQRAYPLFIELMSGPADLVDRFFGDELTDDGARMLASVSGGDIEPIKTLIENPDAYDFVRSAGLDALLVLVAQGARTREEILDYYGSLFREKLPRTEGFIWGALVTASLELYPDALYADIQQVFADDLVDPFDCDLEYVDIVMGRGKDEVLAELPSNPHRTYINDTIAELEVWDDPGLDELFDMNLADLFDIPFFPPRQTIPRTPFIPPIPVTTTIVRSEPKVGRNDPCPCGSGLKYKKCHGKRSNQKSAE